MATFHHRASYSRSSTLRDPKQSSSGSLSGSLKDVEKDAILFPPQGEEATRDVKREIEQSEADGQVPIEPPTDENAKDDGPPQPPAIDLHLDPSSYPDGGTQAWLAVTGGFCALIVSFGWINCVGVFQTYYETHQLKRLSPSTVAWITSLETFVMFAGGIWIGRVYDNYGPRVLLWVGTFFHVFGLMMASISKEYYQFILTQGLCSAMGASMIFYPTMSAVTSWFFKRRALAIGIVASGSSLGGVVLPIVVERLVKEVGYPWTMRTCAFLILGLMLVANLTIRSRIPPYPRPVRVMDFISPFTQLEFATLSLSMFLFFLGLFIPFTFIILAGEARGVPPNLAQYLVSILNAASSVGRILPGWVADKWGRFTTFFCMASLTAVITLALWLPGSGTGATVMFALVFGFSSGCIVSIMPALVAHLSDIRQIGVRLGLLYFVISLAVLIGAPIGGQLITADHGGFSKVQLFAGIVMLGGSTCTLALRVQVGGWKVTKKI